MGQCLREANQQVFRPVRTPFFTQAHRRYPGAFDYRPAYGALDSAEDFIGIYEAHLGLTRVHVNVDLGWIEVDKEDRQREAPDREQRVVGLHDGVGEASIFDVASVDEQVDLGAGGAGEGQGADVPADMYGRQAPR